MKKLQNKTGFPANSHYAALVFNEQTIYHPGDQRSRDCPGHGYPEEWETITTVDYVAFSDKLELEKWVISRQLDERTRSNFQIITATPLNLTIKSTIELQ